MLRKSCWIGGGDTMSDTVARERSLTWANLRKRTVTGMADMMNFPKQWEDFLHDYEFEDARRIYTNGSRLIPSFRVKQMMEHYAPVRHGRWEMRGGKRYCTSCGERACVTRDSEDFWYTVGTTYCPNCGCRMVGAAGGGEKA